MQLLDHTFSSVRLISTYRIDDTLLLMYTLVPSPLTEIDR